MRIAIVFLKKVKKYYKFFENRFFRADRLSVRIKYCMHGSLRIIPAPKKVLPCISEKGNKKDLGKIPKNRENVLTFA